MAEITINDTQMVLVTIHPDGPVDGEPTWSVTTGIGTLLSDPSHPQWDASVPPGYQIFLVSETLAGDVEGPVTTEYLVEADVDKGTGIELLREPILVHVVNRATTLGVSFTPATAKP